MFIPLLVESKAGSERDVAFNGGSVQSACQMGRAASGKMNERAVVPEHEVVCLPCVAINVFRPDTVGKQLIKNCTALVFGQTDDLRREALADEQRLAPSFGVSANDGMDHILDQRQL